MSSSNASADLERTLLRYGDDLYRLALLLTPDTASASRALVRAARRLAAAGGTPGELALIEALVAALPPERARPLPEALRRPPEWARPPDDPRAAPHWDAGQAPLLRAIARLPHRARLALGLTLLRDFEPIQIAPLFGGDEAAVRAQVRDALLAVAPAAVPGISGEQLGAGTAPEACRPTRAALALGASALHADGALRAHLALCSACRAAEQSWSRLAVSVEEALRGALRSVHLPPALAAQLAAATHPEAQAHDRWIDRPWARLALVALPVLLVVALLVYPRGRAEPPPATGSGAQTAAGEPLDLVRRAQAQLYTPPADPDLSDGGTRVWHARYALQWMFPSGSLAPLNGEIWIDPASGRQRAQLVHQAGGGPYEFAMGDGRQTAWYAASETYASALYPFNINGQSQRVRFRATPDEQQMLLHARLGMGAWSMADAYLRQAAGAELRAWGRQRDGDGRMLTLVSFRGTSPLGFVPDAPGASGAETTILLAIDADGRLREIRELVGAEGAEQTARTTWRLETDEWMTDEVAVSRTFNIQQAWNGIGDFVDRGAMVSAELPLIPAQQLAPLVAALQVGGYGVFLPASAPPGADTAMLVNLNVSQELSADRLPMVYSGAGRVLGIYTSTSSQFRRPPPNSEAVSVNGQRATLRPTLSGGYDAMLFPVVPESYPSVIVQVQAAGYTRAELLDVLGSIGPPSMEAFRAQAALFSNPYPKDAAFEALVGALAPATAPSGDARHTVERVFKRQAPISDPLADPYHQPPYGGWPEEWTQESWSRGDAAQGTAESVSATRAGDGSLVARQYRGSGGGWDYNALASRVFRYPLTDLVPTARIEEEQLPVMQMLRCGGYRLQPQPNGAKSVVVLEDWRGSSCQNPYYNQLWLEQTGRGGPPTPSFETAPQVGDLADQPLTSVIDLAANGRVTRTQVWAGAPGTGTLVESWERVTDEIVPGAQLPADVFNGEPPAAAIRWELPATFTPGLEVRTVTITETRQLARSPLFVLPEGQTAQASDVVTSTSIVLDHIRAGADPNAPHVMRFFDSDTVFDQALREGYALRFAYTVFQSDFGVPLLLYQGPADTFGVYLRMFARWDTSEQLTVRAAGREVWGWRVTTPRPLPTSWTLFELDGTLFAVTAARPEDMALLDRLQPLTAP